MSQIYVEEIIVYPVKSTTGIRVATSNVLAEGFEFDRRWAVIDAENTVLTAREFPKLLEIASQISNNSIKINIPNFAAIEIASSRRQQVAAKIFGLDVIGNVADTRHNEPLSKFLGIKCSLIWMDEGTGRIMKPEHGGGVMDKVSYADTAPILLASIESLQELNNRIGQDISIDNFRPNIVINGCEPNEEDGWKFIKIGDVLFEVSEQCKRCVFSTIDPQTKLRDEHQEPLRTLATYKKHPRGGVGFGVNLIPRSLGKIRCGDKIEVVDTVYI